MKKFQLLTKSLLVAAMLCVGASAWGADEWAIDLAAIGNGLPDKTNMTISSEVVKIGGTSMGTCTAGTEALNENFLLQTGTTWMFRTGSQGLYQYNSGARAMGMRDCTAGQIITITATGDPNPQTNATLKTQSGNTYTYTVNADGDVKFSPARYLYFTSVSVQNPSATDVDYTVKYVDQDNNELKGSATYSGAPGSPVSLSDTDKAPIYANDKKYVYASDDSEGKTIASDGSTVVTVIFSEASKYSYTLNAVDGDNNLLKVLGSGEQFEGDNAIVYFSKAIFVNNKWYITDAVGNWVFHKDHTSANITFNEDATISYFFEVEDINKSHSWAATGDVADRYSNGLTGRLYINSYAYTNALEGGVYTVTMWGRNHASSTTANVGVYVRDANGNETKCHNQFEDWDKAAQGTKTIMIEIPDGYSLELKNESEQYNSNLEMDYLILRKSGINTMSIVGFTPESGLNDADKWNPAKGFAMTRDADDPSVWTAVVENYIITGSSDAELKYYYKAAANGSFEGYQLPASGNQDYNFNYAEAGAGKYKLTFTANTFTNEVSLAIEKQITNQIYFVNTNEWAKPYAWVWDANNSDYNFTGGTWPGQEMIATGEQIDGKDVYTWSTYELGNPTNIIICNKDNDSERTGDQAFVNGATYKADGSSTVTKTISAAGYATYCSASALDFTSATGLTAYIAEYSVSEGKVSFTPVDNVPANTGVLLKGEAGEYTISTIASSTTNVDANVLKGVTAATTKDPGIFVLMKGAQGVGFYKTTNAFTVGANSAYIEIPSAARTFIGFDDMTTAIEAVSTMQQNGEVYDLQGRRVVAPQKGLYIINGKKVVIK